MIALGVNIDHVATVRQQRRGQFPDPVEAALEAERAGADSIVAHLREDRRHIQDDDIVRLRAQLATALHMEMAATPAMVEFALAAAPPRVCFVPEKREELTTEGGLDVVSQRVALERTLVRFKAKQIETSLFIDADKDQVKCAKDIGADCIELHTGTYADATTSAERNKELSRLSAAAEQATTLHLHLHAGHGLDYRNVLQIAQLPGMEELNIGFSIISRSLFVGLTQAVCEMKELIKGN